MNEAAYVDFKPDKPLVVLPENLTLDIAAWMHRDLPPPDNLMGFLLSTTCRVLLTAPTGLGKTTLGLAIGFRAAIGHDFLHWKATRAARVLYIDGEMSRRQMNAKIADEIRRCGHVPDAMWFLSREDAEDMQPLDTPKGQAYVDAVIDRVKGVDLIVFDNVQSLLTPDEAYGQQAWDRTLPWIRSLTRRCIGQIWIHHTGHDETKGFGTSTRAWQMDTSILMERVTREDTDIAFSLKFLKARERSPETRADFEPVTITLANDVWSCDAAAPKKPTKLKPDSYLVLEVLRDTIARTGKIPPASNHIPMNKQCVNVHDLRSAWWARGDYSKLKPNSVYHKFTAALDGLRAAGMAGKYEEDVWLI